MENICIKRRGKHQVVYKYCIRKKDLPKETLIDESKILGEGQYGVVLGGMLDGTPIALKIVPLDVDIPTVDCGLKTDGGGCEKYSEINFQTESKIAKEFGELGVTPKVYYSDILNISNFYKPPSKDALDIPEKLGVMIMDRFGISLTDLVRDEPKIFLNERENIRVQILEYIKLFYDLGYFNIDTHFGNILYDVDTRKVKLLDLDLIENKEPLEEIIAQFNFQYLLGL